MEIVVVTGMSGAGKSSAIRILEDLDYFCIDNLPPQLMTAFLKLADKSSEPLAKVAVGIDIRGREFFREFKNMLDFLQENNFNLSILFMEASDESLIRRYKEHRRPHPLDKMGNIYDGIQRERVLLDPVKRRADVIIDSGNLTLGQLKRKLEGRYYKNSDEGDMLISVTSFGYKKGILLDADLVVDVRFLPNPYYVQELKGLSGLDEKVRDYVLKNADAEKFMASYIDLLESLIPLYYKEGKRNLVIGIGCTGGQHRSVAIAEAMGKALIEHGHHAKIYHRDRASWKIEGSYQA